MAIPQCKGKQKGWHKLGQLTRTTETDPMKLRFCLNASSESLAKDTFMEYKMTAKFYIQ